MMKQRRNGKGKQENFVRGVEALLYSASVKGRSKATFKRKRKDPKVASKRKDNSDISKQKKRRVK